MPRVFVRSFSVSLDGFGAGPAQGLHLGVGERLAAGVADQCPRAVEVVQQLRRGEYRPHPLERLKLALHTLTGDIPGQAGNGANGRDHNR